MHGVTVKIYLSFVSLQLRTLYRKTYLRLIVAGFLNFAKNIVVQQSLFLYSLEWRVAQQNTECIVLFPRQQWLRERTPVVRYSMPLTLFT